MDLTTKKAAFAAQAVALAQEVLRAAQHIDELVASYSVSGFNTGGSHAYLDADFTVNNQHLSASIMADVLFALATVQGTLTTGVRNSLREGLSSGLP